MKRKKLNSLFLLAVLLVGNAFAQKDKPNFSGIWNFDKRKSTLVFGGDELSSFGQSLFNCSIKMSVEHNEPELLVKQNSACADPNKVNKSLKITETVSKYFTDGREEVNTTSRNELVESKTEWRGNKIIITTFQTNAKNGKKKNVFIRQLGVSKDNQELIERSASKGNFASLYTKMVFRISK